MDEKIASLCNLRCEAPNNSDNDIFPHKAVVQPCEFFSLTTISQEIEHGSSVVLKEFEIAWQQASPVLSYPEPSNTLHEGSGRKSRYGAGRVRLHTKKCSRLLAHGTCRPLANSSIEPVIKCFVRTNQKNATKGKLESSRILAIVRRHSAAIKGLAQQYARASSVAWKAAQQALIAGNAQYRRLKNGRNVYKCALMRFVDAHWQCSKEQNYSRDAQNIPLCNKAIADELLWFEKLERQAQRLQLAQSVKQRLELSQLQEASKRHLNENAPDLADQLTTMLEAEQAALVLYQVGPRKLPAPVEYCGSKRFETIWLL